MNGTTGKSAEAAVNKYIVILGTPPARIDATEKLMTAIGEAVGETDLQGFTLFKVKAGFQLSTRRKNEDGWIVKIIPDDRAKDILSALELEEFLREGNRMPVKPLDQGFEASLDAATEAVRALTRAIEAWTPA